MTPSTQPKRARARFSVLDGGRARERWHGAHGGREAFDLGPMLRRDSLIRRALEQTKGNRTQAAKLLEISHRALLYKIKDYGIR